MARFFTPAAAILASIVVASLPVAHAQLIEQNTTYGAFVGSASDQNAREFDLSGSFSVGGGVATSGGHAQVEAHTFAHAGRLGYELVGGAEAEATAGSGVKATAFSNTDLSYSDQLSFYSATHPRGSLISVTLRAVVQGKMGGRILNPELRETGDSFATMATAFFSLESGAGDGTAFFQHRDFRDDAGEIRRDFGTPFMELNVTLRNDPTKFYALTESLSGRGAALATAGHASRFNVDLRGGIAWAGATLTDSGSGASDLSIGSESGIDYNRSYVTPVPESSALGVVGGIGLIAGIVARWRARRRG